MAVSYKRLFHLLIERDMTTTQLQQQAGFSSNIIPRMKRNGYVALEKEQAHNLFMSAENIQGNLLEEYISVSARPYGWIWCAGNTLRAIDFCSSDGAVLLQVKNKSNTENSSSSNIRQGTTILKWYRLGTKTVRGQKIPTYKWAALNAIINEHRTLSHLPPCNMTEDHYIQFISNLANQNHSLITAE